MEHNNIFVGGSGKDPLGSLPGMISNNNKLLEFDKHLRNC